jgi:hypothetical protein
MARFGEIRVVIFQTSKPPQMIFKFYFCREGANGGWAGCGGAARWTRSGANEELKKEEKEEEKEVPEGTVQKKGGEEEKKIQEGEVQNKVKLSTVASPPTSHLELQQSVQRIATP